MKKFLTIAMLTIISIAQGADKEPDDEPIDWRQFSILVEQQEPPKRQTYTKWKLTSYFCELCQLHFNNKKDGDIVSHMRRMHELCYYCSFKGSQGKLMNHHIKNHTKK